MPTTRSDDHGSCGRTAAADVPARSRSGGWRGSERARRFPGGDRRARERARPLGHRTRRRPAIGRDGGLGADVTGRTGDGERPATPLLAQPAANSRRQPPAPCRDDVSPRPRGHRVVPSRVEEQGPCGRAGPGRPALSPGDCPRPHAATPPGAVKRGRAHPDVDIGPPVRPGEGRSLSAITTLPYATSQAHYAGRQSFATVSGSPCSRPPRSGTPPPAAAAVRRRAGWRRPRSARSAPGRPGQAPPQHCSFPASGAAPTPRAGR